jgi:flagellar motor switch protein FliM
VRVHESTGVMALCMPYRSIETVAPSLTAHSYFSGQRTNAEPLSLRDGLDEVEVDVRAEIGAVELRIEDVLGLQVGDVVRLGVPAEEGGRLFAGPAETYRVFPGSFRRQLAVQVQEKISRPLLQAGPPPVAEIAAATEEAA